MTRRASGSGGVCAAAVAVILTESMVLAGGQAALASPAVTGTSLATAPAAPTVTGFPRHRAVPPDRQRRHVHRGG